MLIVPTSPTSIRTSSDPVLGNTGGAVAPNITGGAVGVGVALHPQLVLSWQFGFLQ